MQNNTFFGHSTPYSIIVLEEIPSTNDYAKQLLSNFKPQIPFTAILARHQSQGRGLRGNTWLTKPGENLTVSYVFSPDNLPVNQQFALTVISSLALYDCIQEWTKKPVSIKWPNDILVNKKKIAGMLIENKIRGTNISHAIIGIGCNIYGTEFPEDIRHKTTSLRLENSDINLTFIALSTQIRQRLLHYYQVYQENFDAVLALYNSRLFNRNRAATYEINGQQHRGTILDVEQDGLLRVRIQEQIHKFDLKDIRYLL
ncbi:biotin--[acetyl-CoA-carboxylase] ligase [Sphingobacterium sp. Mn56C]|uniref:biotin--[acetyl-CoA-carboxylase] ligase n=1 Tax=Sphingobacterium sp. Mn56C TaxID=3395261 RepID=UPI003BEC393A